MENFLIIETSTPAASLALADESGITVEKSFTSDRRHNAALFAPLEEMVSGNDSGKFTVILVGSGPGSYSGTRVGIAVAQGAALVSGCRAVAIPSILAVAEALSGKPCLAVGDARRGSYWVAEISNGRLIGTPELTDGAGLVSAIQKAEGCGTAVFCMEPIMGQNIRVSSPSAAGLWSAWKTVDEATRQLWAGRIPQPIYLKPPHITPSKKEVFG